MTQPTPQELNPNAAKGGKNMSAESLARTEHPKNSEYASAQTGIETNENPQTLPPAETSSGDDVESLRHSLRQSKRPAMAVPQKKDVMTARVEHIMEDGLSDAFRAMTPIQRQEFKIQGEKTAFEISALLKKTNIRIKKIFSLLLGWLRLIPGVNRFFLMQEAKIKTDKIISLKRPYDM